MLTFESKNPVLTSGEGFFGFKLFNVPGFGSSTGELGTSISSIWNSIWLMGVDQFTQCISKNGNCLEIDIYEVMSSQNLTNPNDNFKDYAFGFNNYNNNGQLEADGKVISPTNIASPIPQISVHDWGRDIIDANNVCNPYVTSNGCISKLLNNSNGGNGIECNINNINNIGNLMKIIKKPTNNYWVGDLRTKMYNGASWYTVVYNLNNNIVVFVGISTSGWLPSSKSDVKYANLISNSDFLVQTAYKTIVGKTNGGFKVLITSTIDKYTSTYIPEKDFYSIQSMTSFDGLENFATTQNNTTIQTGTVSYSSSTSSDCNITIS